MATPGHTPLGGADTPTTVHGLFFRSVRDHGDRQLFRPVGAEPVTYARAAQRVAVTMTTLRSLELARGDFVVTYTEDSIGIALFDLACSTMGIVPVPVSSQFSARYVAGICRSVGARAVFTSTELLDEVAQLELPTLFFDSGEGTATPPSNGVAIAAEGSGDIDIGPLVEAMDASVDGRVQPFMVQPTSGSTGEPKLVLRPHIAFLRYAHFVGNELAEEPPVMLAVQALTHAFGLHMFTTALSMGGTLAIPLELDTNASLRDVWDLSPNVLTMVPRVLLSFYRQYLRQLAVSPTRSFFPPTVDALLVAGGKPDAAILQVCRDQGISPIEFYGSSEASIVALTPRGSWRPGWAGRIVSDVQLRLAEDGEALVRSPGLMLGYHGAKEATAEALTEDGHYRTGDIGEVSDDGYLRLRGRKADLFNTPEGSYISPARIEALIERLNWVRQAMLVGDGRPYITCCIVVDDPQLEPQTKDGYLDPSTHKEIYERVAPDLVAANHDLEWLERITFFTLFSRPFHSSTYKKVGQGKVRRDRRAFDLLYESRVNAMYAREPTLRQSPMYLHQDRRYRPRREVHVPIVRIHKRVDCRVKCELSTSGHSATCETRDISLMGAFVVGGPDVEVGAAVALAVPGVDGPIHGAVVRATAEGIAIRFDELSDATLGQLTLVLAAFD